MFSSRTNYSWLVVRASLILAICNLPLITALYQKNKNISILYSAFLCAFFALSALLKTAKLMAKPKKSTIFKKNGAESDKGNLTITQNKTYLG